MAATPAPMTSYESSPQPAGPTGALMAIATKLKDYSMGVFKQGKPWSEVVDRNSFSKPANFAEAAGRLRKNAAYFKVNYLIVMLITLAVTFLLHPSSLIVLGLLTGGWIYVFLVRTQPLTIGGRTLSEREKLLGMSALSFITVFFLTSVGTVLFSALSVSFCVIALHGAMRVPDDLFLDDAEQNTGLLNIFSTATTPAVTMSTAV